MASPAYPSAPAQYTQTSETNNFTTINDLTRDKLHRSAFSVVSPSCSAPKTSTLQYYAKVFAIGLYYFDKKDFQKACEHFSSLESEPFLSPRDRILVSFYLGQCLYQLNYLAAAIPYLQMGRSIHLWPEERANMNHLLYRAQQILSQPYTIWPWPI